jgi:hypothetical protein
MGSVLMRREFDTRQSAMGLVDAGAQSESDRSIDIRPLFIPLFSD